MFHKIKVKSKLCNKPCTSMVPDVDWVDWINSAYIWRLQRQNDFCLWDNVSLHLWYLPWPILLCAALPSFLNEPAIPSMPRLRPNHFKGWLPKLLEKNIFDLCTFEQNGDMRMDNRKVSFEQETDNCTCSGFYAILPSDPSSLWWAGHYRVCNRMLATINRDLNSSKQTGQ